MGRTESRPGRGRRAGDDAPCAGGEAAAALSRSGEPWTTRAPAGPRREFGERRGLAGPAVVCARSHPGTRVLPHLRFPLVPQLCAQEPEGDPGVAGAEAGRHAPAGMAWRSRILRFHRRSPTPSRSDWVSAAAPAGRRGTHFFRLTLQLPLRLFLAGSREGAATGLGQTHAKCRNVAGRVCGGGTWLSPSQRRRTLVAGASSAEICAVDGSRTRHLG